MPGTLALIGMSDLGYVSLGQDHGRTPTFEIEKYLLAQASSPSVLYVPTASVEWGAEARESLTGRAVDILAERVGAELLVAPIWDNHDAHDPDVVALAQSATYVYLGGGRPGPLAAALRGTPFWEAVTTRWREGAVLAGESAGSVVLTDYTLGGGEGGFTFAPDGLGLLPRLRVVPHSDTPKGQLILAAALAETELDSPVVAIPEFTAVVREPDGSWHQIGEGGVVVLHGGTSLDLSALSSVIPAGAA